MGGLDINIHFIVILLILKLHKYIKYPFFCVCDIVDIFKKEKPSISKQRIVTEDGWQDGLLRK